MNTNLTKLIFEISDLCDGAYYYEASRLVHDVFPSKAILTTDDCDFSPHVFANAGGCSLWPMDRAHFAYRARWDVDKECTEMEPHSGLFEILWQSKRIQLLQIRREYETWYALIGDDQRLVESFFEAVCRFRGDDGHSLEFSNGRFKLCTAPAKDAPNERVDRLIIPETIEQALQTDVIEFFDAEATYDRFGIPWKRGVLLHGPPGNGKTATIRSLLKRVRRPSIVVRDLTNRDFSGQHMIQWMYRRARKLAPCIVILEDVDSLVQKHSLSAFLTELDGLRQNRGVITIATTNYPARLDPSLVERPSRFDRKIEFRNPKVDLRARYLRATQESWDNAMRLSDADIETLAKATKGFSFAYLQELAISSTMSWIADPATSMATVMTAQVESLRRQMQRAA